MSRHLFFVLLLLMVLVSCICGPVHAGSTEQPKSVELFVPNKTKVPFKETNGTVTEKDVNFFYSPFLVSADGVMVAFAKAKHTVKDVDEKKEVNTDVLAKYIGTDGVDWAKNVTENDGNNWETQLALQNPVYAGTSVIVENMMAVTKDNKIYLLASRRNALENQYSFENNQNLDFVMTVGDVTNSTEKGKKIEWQTPKELNSTLTQQMKVMSFNVSTARSYSFLTKDGKIVFVMSAIKDNKDGFAIVHINNTEKETELELTHVETTEGCEFSSFFEWEGKLMMAAYCENGTHTVKESIDMGKTWTDVSGPISRLLGDLRGKEDFTTVTIDNKTVLLFTESVNAGASSEAKYEIYLWMSDGNHVYRAGPVASNFGRVTFSKLLYTNNELFSLHEEHSYFGGTDKIILTRLKDQIDNIKSVLKFWAEKDEYLSKPCNKTTPQGTPCVTPMPTDGLVGFLSNTTSGDNNNIWVDEYFYVNVTVKGGTKVDNGFTFRGTNSGAEWLIGLQGQSQRYNFARYGLTVVATVTIHDAPESDSPLLSIGLFPNNKHVGLWYNKDKQWKVKSMNGNVFAGDWEANRTYHVALVLNNSNLSAYIDGNLGGSLLRRSTHEEGLFGIQHIFIGGYKEEDSRESENTEGNVTVTNVFLYNRPLNATEVNSMGKKRAETLESPGHTGDTAELPRHTGDTAELPRHTGDTAELPRHTGDTAQFPRHTGDTAELPKHTVQKNEANKQLQTILNVKNTGDGSLYMPVGTSLLCLLGLWGLAALC